MLSRPIRYQILSFHFSIYISTKNMCMNMILWEEQTNESIGDDDDVLWIKKKTLIRIWVPTLGPSRVCTQSDTESEWDREQNMLICGCVWSVSSIFYGVWCAWALMIFEPTLNSSQFQNQINFSIQILRLLMLSLWFNKYRVLF